MKFIKKYMLCVFAVMALCVLLFTLPAFASPKLAKKKMTVKAGNVVVLNLKGNKKHASVKWKTSSKAKLQIVGKSNYRVVLYAKKSGKAKVTAKVGGKKLSATVTIRKNSGFPEALTLVKGLSFSFKMPAKTTWSYRYSSIDGGIATMTAAGTSAKLTVNRAGYVTIYARSGGKTYTCKVTVLDKNGNKLTERESLSYHDGYLVKPVKKYANEYGYCDHWFAEVGNKYIYVLAEGNYLEVGDGLVLGVQSNMKKLNIESRGSVTASWLSGEESATLSWASEYEYGQILEISANKKGKGYVDLYGTVKGVEIRMTIPIIVK